MELAIEVLIGIGVAAFLVDMAIHPLFDRSDRIREQKLETRIKTTSFLPRMTKQRAEELLGIKSIKG